MSKKILVGFTTVALALVAGAALAQKPAEAKKPLKASADATISVTAVVEAIDYKTREVTLKSPDRTLTVEAGPDVQRLEQVHKGDSVTVTYRVGLLAEAREATPEEKANPKQISAGGGRTTTAAGKPAGGAEVKAKVVATVVAIDKPNQEITFKGPGGHTETLFAEHPENLDKVKVGDTVVFTYTEALALSVTPAGAKPAAKQPTSKAEPKK